MEFQIIFKNRGNNITKPFNILVWVLFTPSKAELEMPNDVRLRILRNQEISGKYQSWLEAEPSVLISLPEITLWTQQLNITENQISKFFLFFPFLLDFFYCPINFFRDCLCKQYCPYNSQSSSNVNTLVSFYILKATLNFLTQL